MYVIIPIIINNGKKIFNWLFDIFNIIKKYKKDNDKNVISSMINLMIFHIRD